MQSIADTVYLNSPLFCIKLFLLKKIIISNFITNFGISKKCLPKFNYGMHHKFFPFLNKQEQLLTNKQKQEF